MGDEMKGTTFKRRLPSGKTCWCFQVDVGRNAQNQRVRISRSGFTRKADADRELARVLRDATTGLLAKPDPRTLADFMEEWLQQHAEQNCSPKTSERYRELANSYLLPHLGTVKLSDLSTLKLERLYTKLRRCGGRKGRPLSPKTVRHVAGLVHCALNAAVRWKLLPINPATACQLPKAETKERKIAERQQLEWLFDAARGHPWLHALLVTAAATGCRRGELLALTWADVSPTDGLVVISKSLEQTRAGLRVKSPKNGRTRRVLLPASAIAVLEEHRRDQQQLREAFREAYRSDLDLVFAAPEGGYLKPGSVTAKVCLLASTCGLRGIGLHSLRHSHGSELLSAGVPLPTVSKRLGHTNTHVTASIYAHALSTDEIAAAEAWDARMASTVQSKAVRQ